METQSIIPQAVFSGVDAASGPLHLAVAFFSVVAPRVVMTKAMQGMSEQQKQAEAASRAREQKMQAAGFGGADVNPLAGLRVGGFTPQPGAEGNTDAHPDWGPNAIPPVDPNLYGAPPAMEMSVDPSNGHAVIRIPTIGMQ